MDVRRRNDETGTPILASPVRRVLTSMSVPIGLAMVSTFFFQLVDTYFVGQLGPLPLTALGFAGAVYLLMVALFMGMAVGVSALVGAALGRQDPSAARHHATLAVVLAVALAVALGWLGRSTIVPLFELLGATAEVMPLITAYMDVIYAGWAVLVFTLIGIAAIQARGHVALPALIMGAAGFINAALDWVLIYGVGPFPELGFRGAALATVASWSFAALSILIVLLRHELLAVPRGRLAGSVAAILRASAPPVAAQLLLPTTGMLLTYLAAQAGPEVVAAIGVTSRVETLGMVGVSALVNALVPFVAQNFGAGRTDRVRHALRFGNATAWVWGAGLAVLLIGLGSDITRLFTGDAAIAWNVTLYFHFVAPSYGALGIVSVASALLNGVQEPDRALRLLLAKTLLLTVPLAVIGAQFGVTGLFAAIGAGNLGGALLAVRATRRWSPPEIRQWRHRSLISAAGRPGAVVPGPQRSLRA